MKLRDLLREQEEPQAYRVAIELDSGTIVLTVPIPMTALQREDIEERLKAYIEKHKATYNIDDTSFSVWYPVDDENNKVELPDVDLPDVEITEPSDVGTKEPKRNVATPGESDPVEEPEAQKPEAEPEVRSSGGVRYVSQMQSWAERYNRNNDNQWPRMNGYGDLVDEEGNVVGSIDDVVEDNPELLGRAPQDERTQQILQGDDDGDGIIDDTGEPVKIQTDMYDIPDASDIQRAREFQAEVDAKFGGGADGDTGDEGVSGEEGAVTGEQRAEIPSIIEELRDAMQGPGTSEGQMIDALKRIGSPAHLEAVVQMYRQEYGDSLPQDMIDEFKYDLGGNNAAQVEEINRVMRPLGWEIVGMRYSTMRWQKIPGVEVEITPAGEE